MAPFNPGETATDVQRVLRALGQFGNYAEGLSEDEQKRVLAGFKAGLVREISMPEETGRFSLGERQPGFGEELLDLGTTQRAGSPLPKQSFGEIAARRQAKSV